MVYVVSGDLVLRYDGKLKAIMAQRIEEVANRKVDGDEGTEIERLRDEATSCAATWEMRGAR